MYRVENAQQWSWCVNKERKSHDKHHRLNQSLWVTTSSDLDQQVQQTAGLVWHWQNLDRRPANVWLCLCSPIHTRPGERGGITGAESLLAHGCEGARGRSQVHGKKLTDKTVHWKPAARVPPRSSRYYLALQWRVGGGGRKTRQRGSVRGYGTTPSARLARAELLPPRLSNHARSVPVSLGYPSRCDNMRISARSLEFTKTILNLVVEEADSPLVSKSISAPSWIKLLMRVGETILIKVDPPSSSFVRFI